MFTRQNLVRFVLAGLLLALLAVPVLGAALGSGHMAATDNSDSTLLFHNSPTEGAGVVIACTTGDPGGNGGGGC